MSITEEERHRLYQVAEATFGTEEAATLMKHLPPTGWADVATKRDLDHLEAIMDARFEAVDARIDAAVHRQTLVLIPVIAAMFAIFGAISALL